MEEAIIARLRANTALAALVSTRNSRPSIDWLDRGPLDCVTLQDVDQGRGYSHDGATGLDQSTVQIDCWGQSYGAAKLISRAVINALEESVTVAGVKFTHAFLISSRSFEPEDLPGGGRVFRQSLDFQIWNKPA